MRKQANFKLPEELITALQDRAAEERTTATDLVIQALNYFLGEPEKEDSDIENSIYNIADSVEQLKARPDELGANKIFYFMQNSPSAEANDIDIRIESDTLTPNNSQEHFVSVSKFEELELQNQSLCERVTALESLLKQYRYQDFSRNIEREFQ